MSKYILASSSPRRRELFASISNDFSIKIPDVDEDIIESDPEKLVTRLSSLKANAINSEKIIVAADTIVWYNGIVLGKPKDKEDAIRTLKNLSGNVHYVYTGVCIRHNDKSINFCVKTKILFRILSDTDILEYVNSGKPMDKAGSYGIQETDFVKEIDGSYSNVVGLPLEELKKHLTNI